MNGSLHLTPGELEAAAEHLLQSPADGGVLEMIVCRPRTGEREVLPAAQLDLAAGLVGDNWVVRGSTSTPDRAANPLMQINVMNARVIALLARARERWPLAGDQLFVDLDLSAMNLPVGMQLELGTAIIEVTPPPHTGCAKFTERFGAAAVRFVNSPRGRQHRWRGLNAKVIQPGTIRTGDVVRKR